MNILLACNAGMSTSLLAEMMRQESIKQNKKNEIWCIDIEKVGEEINKCDILLLGPQVKHALKRLIKEYGEYKPIIMIPANYYGKLDGKAVLLVAEDELENYYS